jgi:hypothetical protein
MEAQPLISVKSSRTLSYEETAKALKSFLKKNSKENSEGRTVGSVDLLEKLSTVVAGIKQSKPEEASGTSSIAAAPGSVVKAEKKKRKSMEAADAAADEDVEMSAKKKKKEEKKHKKKKE